MTNNNDLTNLAVQLLVNNRQVDNSILNPISLLQRHFILGHNAALNLLEELKREGVVSKSSENANMYLVHATMGD